MSAAFPGLRFVIEYIAKPDIAGREITSWRAGMAPFAEQPRVWCKLTGMVTEADLAHWKAADYSPYVTAVMGWFGEDRLMFGSDWPVCLLGGAPTPRSRLGWSHVWEVCCRRRRPRSSAGTPSRRMG